MILQALVNYFSRSDQLPQLGWVRHSADYEVLLDNDGICIAIESLGEIENGRTTAKEMLLPAIGKQAKKHTNSGVDANLLWDKASFSIGYRQDDEKIDKKLDAFIYTIKSWFPEEIHAVQMVLRFCNQLQLMSLQERGELLDRFNVKDIFDKKEPSVVFRIKGNTEPVHALPNVREYYQRHFIEVNRSERIGVCSITGQVDANLVSNESVLKGITGKGKASANIISFNKDSFESYGKSKGENVVVGERASFAYTTALQHLLNSSQRIEVGGTSTVFWADKQNQIEDDLPIWFGESDKDNPDRKTRKIKTLYESVRRGGFSPDDDSNLFFILGLVTQSKARITVRFWQVATVAEISHRIIQHFNDLAIDHAPHEPPYPSLFRLLVHTATLGKADNIPPNLGGEFMRAIISGTPYPHTLLQAAVRRSRAERNIGYYRAALIKAVLNRKFRLNPQSLSLEKEIAVSLDRERKEIGYRLGRLFSVLETIQEKAQGEINAGIRDRYYGSASSSPRSVFSTLMKLKNHHLAKLEASGYYEKMVGEIMEGIEQFPPQLNLEQQGLFAIGYYHQQQDRYKSHKSKEQPQTENGSVNINNQDSEGERV